MTTLLKSSLLVVSCLLLTACSSSLGLREDFDKSTKAYNRMLRWHEVENAGMLYVDKDQRADFMKQAEMFKTRGVTLTDFRILTTECLPERKSGEVIAEFDYFVLPSNKIKTMTYRQEWTYKDLTNSWKLKNGLPKFD